MGATERAYDRGTRQGGRWLRITGEEYRSARLSLGLAQRHVAESAHISPSVYGRIERGVLPHLSILQAARLASVLGLELSVRIYPGGSPTRDAAHGERLQRLLHHVADPLRYRTEVPLPATTDHPERRSWDAILFGHGERTAIELETRLYDVQAQLRRIQLKRRDDPPDHLLLVLADTGANRRASVGLETLLPDLPRLKTANVLRTLRAGHLPPTGWILL
jgi:transcriptional regulator with XRE-family HTH domain